MCDCAICSVLYIWKSSLLMRSWPQYCVRHETGLHSITKHSASHSLCNLPIRITPMALPQHPLSQHPLPQHPLSQHRSEKKFTLFFIIIFLIIFFLRFFYNGLFFGMDLFILIFYNKYFKNGLFYKALFLNIFLYWLLEKIGWNLNYNKYLLVMYWAAYVR